MHRYLMILLFSLTALTLRANVVYDIAVDTSARQGQTLGLDFQLNGLAGSTVLLTGFDLGGGMTLGPASLVGGVSGSLPSGIELTTNPLRNVMAAFFNSFQQGFRAGSQLRFRATLDAAGGVTPDGFSMTFLDSTGGEIATLSPLGGFVLIDLSSPVIVQTFASADGSIPMPGASLVNVGSDPVPEPAAGLLVTAGMLILAGARRLRCR